jgi:hypothetical protein
MHPVALHGGVRAALDALADWVTRRHAPRLLH